MTEKTPGLGAPFLDQLVDWRRFEDFVREVQTSIRTSSPSGT
jgi:hypothetical protein